MTVQIAEVPELARGILDHLKEPDRRPISQWAVGNVVMPDSKRNREWAEDTAYWLIEPLNAIPYCEAVSVCKPTQSGGTVIYIVFLLWLIANSPVDLALMGQTDPDAEYILKAKILPALRSSPATAALMAALGRNAVTKNYIDLGTMTFRIHGPGKNSAQSASLEVLLLDECWLFKLGTILEILERTSTKAATRKIVAVSQAGEEYLDRRGKPTLDEWGAWWVRGTQEIYHVRCPHCSQYFEPRATNEEDGTFMFRVADDARDPQTKEWNWTRVRETAHLVTPCCGHVVENTARNRRSLSASGKYIATNKNPSPRHRSFRYPCWVVYWQDWGELLEQFLRAQDALKQGNIEPLKIWTQKKEARWWTMKLRELPVLNTRGTYGYTKDDYTPKDDLFPKWEKERFRIMTVDVQSNHFVVVIRAWALDGSSRLIWEGHLGSWDTVEDWRKLYRVPANLVAVDANDFTQAVYARCLKMNYVALHGCAGKGFIRVEKKRRYNMPWEEIEGRHAFARRGARGVGCRAFNFSNLRYKDQLSILVAGQALPWEHADDVRPEYIESLESEKKNEKGIWDKVRAYNHTWDCEVMQLCMASLPGVEVLRYEPEPEDEEEEKKAA